MPVLYVFLLTSGPRRAFAGASEESSFEPGGRGNLLVFGSISLSHPLLQSRPCTRTNQFDGATAARGQHKSLLTGSTQPSLFTGSIASQHIAPELHHPALFVPVQTREL